MLLVKSIRAELVSHYHRITPGRARFLLWKIRLAAIRRGKLLRVRAYQELRSRVIVHEIVRVLPSISLDFVQSPSNLHANSPN